MVRFSFAAALFAATALAVPSPLTPDPAGAKNIGNGRGAQFIGGACLNSRDCASACCAILNGAGICSGVGAQFQAGKQGCGFGGGGAAAAPAFPQVAVQASPSTESAAGNGSPAGSGASGSSNVGAGNGQQFITGQCLSDADCASGCCAGPKGACAARAVAEENGKSGCGFTGAGSAAGSTGGGGGDGGATAGNAAAAPAAPPPQTAPSAGGGSSGANQNAAGSQNVGKGNGQQFITGQCLSDADCASGCCAGPKGACSAVAVANASGKTGCGFKAA
ncbi:uncharacterized protein LY79DRAFT_316706 [Colletotrichum navitas]|uniref:Biotrophy-associated secreted protein 2 n=1 Tax=Colletotrichum navitas TaxID=681940 RepID=A0AAD8PTZ6_9PEZI|nr:uncharacterized protein LY79DRAFT_316706 [Colletotrichum navitas]KAK1580170.1 hypothetical protein LY79DRAFT_316706 [Colletotrichum navitas]